MGWGGVLLRPFINFAVGVFVFLSGALTKKRADGRYNDLIARRLRKCMIPYILWSFLYAVINGRLNTFFPDIFFSKCNGIYYFILVYAQMVILTPIAFKLLDSSISWIGYFFTPVTILLIRYVCVIREISVGFPFQGELFTFWFAFYYFGLALENQYYVIKLNWSNWIQLYGISILVQLVEGSIWYKIGNYDLATTQLKFSSILTTSIVCYGVFMYFTDYKGTDVKLFDFGSKIMVILGNNSFGIYLCHMLIWRALGKIVPKINIFPINTVLTIL